MYHPTLRSITPSVELNTFVGGISAVVSMIVDSSTVASVASLDASTGLTRTSVDLDPSTGIVEGSIVTTSAELLQVLKMKSRVEGRGR